MLVSASRKLVIVAYRLALQIVCAISINNASIKCVWLWITRLTYLACRLCALSVSSAWLSPAWIYRVRRGQTAPRRGLGAWLILVSSLYHLRILPTWPGASGLDASDARRKRARKRQNTESSKLQPCNRLTVSSISFSLWLHSVM